MGKLVKLGSVVALFGLSVWFFFTPHLAVSSMKTAAEARDTATLASYVDFPSVKESLKATLNAKIVSEVSGQQEENPFAALGAAMTMAFIGPMIDALVTPESLARMMEGEKPEIGESPSEASKASDSSPEVSMAYQDFNRFLVTARQKGTDNTMTFVLSRDGIASWKLTSIQLPL
jgi:hypothetical protein